MALEGRQQSPRRTADGEVSGERSLCWPKRKDFHPSVLVGRLARDGCTRIGSPGIFGVWNTEALFRAVELQVTDERKWGSHRANPRASDRPNSLPLRHPDLDSR